MIWNPFNISKSYGESRCFDRLREMGIEDGDVVKIYELEFEFYN